MTLHATRENRFILLRCCSEKALDVGQERCCRHEVLKESCEGRTTHSTFPFCLLRVSVKCKESQERNSMLVLPFSSTACWKGTRFTVHLLKSTCRILSSLEEAPRKGFWLPPVFCSDLKCGQQTSPIFHVFSVISISFMAVEDVGNSPFPVHQ